jgi:uridine monophosphate synthetase
MNTEQLILELFNIGCIKFGEFTLKSGQKSPIYFDLRILVSYPNLLVNFFFSNFSFATMNLRVYSLSLFFTKNQQLAAELIWKKAQENAIEYDLVCGVPYGAVPLATVTILITFK